ncbi:hypothetical protein [Thauera sinica]|uniref:Uncharacterized protein n=1 Tax=Thauera sinica TaxID=2665146 RepID=A0ABW1ARK9_9RHOO|nr:hypothetical protein [Thauera sp. K11]
MQSFDGLNQGVPGGIAQQDGKSASQIENGTLGLAHLLFSIGVFRFADVLAAAHARAGRVARKARMNRYGKGFKRSINFFQIGADVRIASPCRRLVRAVDDKFLRRRAGSRDSGEGTRCPGRMGFYVIGNSGIVAGERPRTDRAPGARQTDSARQAHPRFRGMT